MTSPGDAAVRQNGDQLAAEAGPSYELTLFVSGASGLAVRAITNARALCETYLAGRYSLSVVDVYENVQALITNDVLATPTLVKNLPLPTRKIVGDLSQTEKVLRALDLPAAEAAARKIS
jgi:circadian clock protein KaiB